MNAALPLDNAKSELFLALGHPVRIRVIELLDDGPKTVSHLSESIAIEGSKLSHQLAVLRGTGLVIARRVGTTVEYSLSSGEVAGVLRAAHEVLAHSAPAPERSPAVSNVEHAW